MAPAQPPSRQRPQRVMRLTVFLAIVPVLGVCGIALAYATLNRPDPIFRSEASDAETRAAVLTAVPIGSTADFAIMRMEAKTFRCEAVHDTSYSDQQELDKGFVGGEFDPVRHAEVLLCRANRPLLLILITTWRVVFLIRDGAVADAAVSRFGTSF